MTGFANVNRYMEGEMSQSTIQDVAKAAGVSVATVSRVLNDSPSVSGKTRDTVLEVIRKLGYQPNLLGRNLRRTQTKLVLVLLPSIANQFYSKVVKGIEDVAHKNGYNIMLCNTDSDRNREKVYIALLKNRLADGVILMASELGDEELSQLGRSFPVVQCSEYKGHLGVSYAAIDNKSAACREVGHLIGLGHKRIGMISCRNKLLSTIKREEGYQKALQEAGIAFDDALVAYGDYGFTSGMRASRTLLKLPDRPTAIFAISDNMAIGAMKAARESGLEIPSDLAVAGFDNISFAVMCEPMLTTISQPKYELGCTAMEVLLRQMRGERSEPEEVLLEYELVIRGSTVR